MSSALIDSCVAQVKAEIRADVASGVVPASVASFSELHDYVDANCYGGLCDSDSPHHAAAMPDGTVDAGFVNSVQDAVDAWLEAGSL